MLSPPTTRRGEESKKEERPIPFMNYPLRKGTTCASFTLKTPTRMKTQVIGSLCELVTRNWTSNTPLNTSITRRQNTVSVDSFTTKRDLGRCRSQTPKTYKPAPIKTERPLKK